MIFRPCIGILFFVAMSACSPRPAKVDNQDGVVTSVGPITEHEEGEWIIQFSVFDFEGDPVDVIAEIAAGDDPWTTLEHCSESAAPCLKQKLRGLSSRADGHDEQHMVHLDSGGLNLSKTAFRLYALEDRSDVVIWPNP